MKKLFGLVFVLAIILPASQLSAQGVQDFVINDFHADYLISNSAVGGSLLTTETIMLDFSGQNHGILRAVPKTHQGYDTKIKIVDIQRDGQKEPYSTYSDSGNLVMKIGDADSTITGKHTYKIVYSQERIINFKEAQQFYWDINGTDWLQPFEKVSATVGLAEGEFVDGSALCYSGVQGSTATNCQAVSSGKSASFSAENLAPGEGLTLGVNIAGVNFVQPTLSDKLKDNVVNIIGLIFGLIIAGFSYRVWHRRGKDYGGKGTIVPEYTPPKNLSPAEVGMLADYNVDGRDMSASLIDLAVRGYIKIHQETSKFLFAKTHKFKLELLKTDFAKLKTHETQLINGVFETVTKGEIAELSKLNRTKMASAVTSIRSSVKNDMMKKYGLIDEKADKSQGFMLLAGFGLFFAGIFMAFLPNGFQLGLAVAGVFTAILGFAMRRRTHAGEEIYDQIKGLKLYMDTAEKDRMKMMQSVDRPYAEPTKTPELFEKLLPFAVALGVEKSWAKQFSGILTQQPTWIDGNAAAFSSAHLASSLGGISSNFSSSFESSSGASGGSSGGGGGGGGGGGW